MDKGVLQQFIEWIIHNGGLYVLLLVIFVETGVFFCFFLPGDSLLFAAGFYVDELAKQFFDVNYSVIILLIIIAAILGNTLGYWFGYKVGPLLYQRKDSFFFKKKHLIRAHDFYEEYGKATIFLGIFLPIVRTFAPIVAGIVKMDKKTFMLFNIIGSSCWVAAMILGGKFLQGWMLQKYRFDLKNHVDVIVIGLAALTLLPVLFKVFLHKKKPNDTPIAN